MHNVAESASVVFISGLLLILGVYLSYSYPWAYSLIGVGAVVFVLGLHLDLRRCAS